MAKKLLIDANHPEEVRVAVVNGNLLEEFDSETSIKRHIKSNIYLAKVVRVEPSLQAAFVDFGGNRHGFLSFSEIHPDYYRIPVADREVLIKETLDQDDHSEDPLDLDTEDDAETDAPSSEDDAETEEAPETKPARNKKPMEYRYKIQEVIKRRQIMLVQVVKEERGNKGAALTTYLSLPGRYCVLMPNAGVRGGGVSRKINDGEDRRRLRDLVKELGVPDGMGLIVRTAGQERNKIEIKRDYEYLLRLWSDIRELTLKSIAPCLVYAEGDLVKRSIRDIYSRDIDQILVEGEESYKTAKAFMRTLIPSHARKVQLYKDETIPLFHRFRVEEQINHIMHPIVRLISGGSIVINATEALVAIDVNSGKATRERHIDDTALKTNLEAADEIARQMRLRDLAGLIVIDFIDMNDQHHIHQVEKRLRDATKTDRARIQLGHISQFGLMELSRQRLRPSLMETHTTTCSHCHGVGFVRSTESTALHVLRAIETQAIQKKAEEILVAVPGGIDLYLLNQKRSSITSIESRFGITIHITRDASLNPPDFRIDILAEQEPSGGESFARPIEQAETPEVNPGPFSDDESADRRPKKGRNRRQRRPHQELSQKKPEDGEPIESQEPKEVIDQEAASEEKGNVPKNANQRRRQRNRQFRRRPRQPMTGDNKAGDSGGSKEGGSEDKGAPPKAEPKVVASKPDALEETKTKRKPKGWLSRLLD